MLRAAANREFTGLILLQYSLLSYPKRDSIPEFGAAGLAPSAEAMSVPAPPRDHNCHPLIF